MGRLFRLALSIVSMFWLVGVWVRVNWFNINDSDGDGDAGNRHLHWIP